MDLVEVLEKHVKWLREEPGGRRADLGGADLRWANLSEADAGESAFLHAAAIVEHSADLYELVRAHVKILQRCRESRGLTSAETSFLSSGIALLMQIGGA